MKVNISQLQEGCILTKDVFSLTNKPIIQKKTVLNKELLEVLRAFLVPHVDVESVLSSGELFIPNEIIEEQQPTTHKEETKNETFTISYLKAVKEYKLVFQSWQAGSPVDVGKVRQIILPLLDKVLAMPDELRSLHHYVTRDEYIYHHPIAVGLLSGFIGKKLKYSKADCNLLALAGILSDCGMSKIDPIIYSKKTALTSYEYNEVKKHPLYSYRMIEKISLLTESVKLAVFQHHERVDGTGYILGVNGDQLHPYGKVVAIADVFHAMISERPYSDKQSPFKVIEQITQDSFGKFDVQVVEALTNGIVNISIGTKVKLSNGKVGEVVFIEVKSPTRPMIRLENNEFVQLVSQRELFIDEIL